MHVLDLIPVLGQDIVSQSGQTQTSTQSYSLHAMLQQVLSDLINNFPSQISFLTHLNPLNSLHDLLHVSVKGGFFKTVPQLFISLHILVLSPPEHSENSSQIHASLHSPPQD